MKQSMLFLPIVLFAVFSGGCGNQYYKYSLTIPDIEVGEDAVFTERILEASGTGGAGILDIVCDGRTCRNEGFSGGDRRDLETEILVWLDRDGDDLVEWHEEGLGGDLSLEELVPDDDDPRGRAQVTRGLGIRRIEIELTLPLDDTGVAP